MHAKTHKHTHTLFHTNICTEIVCKLEYKHVHHIHKGTLSPSLHHPSYHYFSSSLFISHLPSQSYSIFHAPLCLLSLSLSVSVSNALSTSSKTYCFSAFCSLLFLCHFVLLSFFRLLLTLFLRHPALTPFLSSLMLSAHPHHLSHSFLLCTPLSLLFVLLLPFFARCLLNSLSISLCRFICLSCFSLVFIYLFHSFIFFQFHPV